MSLTGETKILPPSRPRPTDRTYRGSVCVAAAAFKAPGDRSAAPGGRRKTARSDTRRRSGREPALVWFASSAVWLRADRVKLARVLRNLMNNAIQFTARGGVTVSSALTPARGVLICVTDTGVGIPRENLERIFGDFTHLRTLRSRSLQSGETGGLGLGLAICRRLTGLMGGEISVESEPNRGSVFKVHLPPSRVLQRTFVE